MYIFVRYFYNFTLNKKKIQFLKYVMSPYTGRQFKTTVEY